MYDDLEEHRKDKRLLKRLKQKESREASDKLSCNMADDLNKLVTPLINTFHGHYFHRSHVANSTAENFMNIS